MEFQELFIAEISVWLGVEEKEVRANVYAQWLINS